MAYIEIIQPLEATGELLEVYQGLEKSRGKIAEVHKIQSLNPKSITTHMDLYMQVMFGKSPLKRETRELIATVVSISNNCKYCTIHHAEALNHYWKDDEKIKKLKTGFHNLGLPSKEQALCIYADSLSRIVASERDEERVNDLKKASCSGREILDATLIISYFNFVNRIVQSLGVHLEEEPGGYKY